MAVGTDGGHADAQRHNEWNGHGAGGHAAGIKSDRQKLFGDERGQNEDDAVEQHKEPRQRDAEEHPQKRHDEEQAHACRYRKDQGHVGDGGHLIGQHLQVRLRDGDEEAQQEADPDDEGQAPGLGEHGAHPLAHGGHAHLRAQRKEHDAHNDHGGAQQKAEQDAGGDGGNGKAEHQHNGHNGQHRL